ncbi:MAG: MerR family DNA-binding protein, partial [Natronospirillum sp.]
LLGLVEQPDADCGEVDQLLARHLSHVRARVRELTQLEETLAQMQQACSNHRTISECGILDELNTDLTEETAAPTHNHVPGSHGRRR